MKDKLHKGELSSRENSPMTESSLARAPRNGPKTLLGWMVTGGLWGQKAHIKLSANAGDLGLIPGSGRSPGDGNGNPLQYSCLDNPMDGGAWQATVPGVAKSWTGLSD